MPFIIKQFSVEKKTPAFLFLIRELGMTHKVAQRMISKGRLLCNGEYVMKDSFQLEGKVELIDFEPQTRGLVPIFVTNDFALFDKPSGVLIHPQNRHTPYSLIDEIKHHFGRDANITHRIDQETSGLVLSANNKKSERTLKMMFEERKMQKRYLALVHGEVKEIMDIKEPLLRREDESAIVRMVVRVHPEGKYSETLITPIQYFPELDMTLVEAKPLTGRQHQIRVHLFHVKHPIVGDPIYGQSESDIVRFLDRDIDSSERIKLGGAKRLLLHASQLEFSYGGNDYVVKSKTDFLKECYEAMTT
ncbi:RluA family pseudouridine synthase [Sulfurimonas sp. HSL3-7]|uniref:RluA family pseudouridine synthase n=1 Tax=Sulfonitrofixus jiaomeiensis TaxID=3131938 RepID=UPI0031F76A36